MQNVLNTHSCPQNINQLFVRHNHNKQRRNGIYIIVISISLFVTVNNFAYFLTATILDSDTHV